MRQNDEQAAAAENQSNELKDPKKLIKHLAKYCLRYWRNHRAAKMIDELEDGYDYDLTKNLPPLPTHNPLAPMLLIELLPGSIFALFSSFIVCSGPNDLHGV